MGHRRAVPETRLRARAANRHSLREVVNAVFYLNADGCKRADRPHDLPPPATVSHHSCKWVESGLRQRIDDALREAVRIEAGRDFHPSAGAVDSQTVKAAPTGAPRDDGAESATGHKRHILVDSLAWARSSPPSRAGRRAPPPGPRTSSTKSIGRTDPGCASRSPTRPATGTSCTTAGVRMALIAGRQPSGRRGRLRRAADSVGGRAPRFGWIVQSPRHAKDYERTFGSSEAQISITSARLLLRRIADQFRYRDSGQGKVPQNQRKAA